MPNLISYYDSPTTSAINQPLTTLSWVDTTGTTIDCSTGNAFKLRVNGTSGTISLSGLPPSGIRYALELHLDWASGSITWPIEWNKGDALPTATGGYVITAVTLDGGSSFKIAVMDEALGIVTDGLVLHLDAGNYASYPGSGTTWTDLAGTNDGTLTNGPTFDSANGGSIVFDGSNDVVSSSNCQSIFPGVSGSICAWIKTSNVSRQTIVSGFLTADNNRWDLECDNNKGVMIFHGKNTLTGSTNINTGNWINVCVTNDGSITTLYVNGSSDGSLAIASASFRSNIAFSLGNRTNGSLFPFLGSIAYALTYNRALSATEITQNFEATRGRFGV